MTAAGAQTPGKPALRAILLLAAYWLLPPLFCLWLYRDGIFAWFQADDFAWLSLHSRVHSLAELRQVLFAPMAQGTVRPLSERGFFLGFYHWFGLYALPWRLTVFFTECVNLALLAWMTTRLTASRIAGFAAAVFWAANSSLSTPMAWTSDYNQVLCALFLLGALACWIRHVESGRAGWYWAQWAVFLVGFGALEINVVYPAIAAAYVVCFVERGKWRVWLWRTAPLAVVSVIYFAWHSAVAPAAKSGPYVLHVGPGMVRTLGIYFQWAVVSSQWDALGHSRWIAGVALGLFGALMMALLVRKWPGRRVIWFAWAWFGITITPILPLRDHVSDYYLAIPTIGAAMALGAGLTWNWRLAAPVAAVYLAMMVPAARFGTQWYADRSQKVKTLVLGVLEAKEKHPGKAILLDGVSDDLYALAVAHSAFRSLGIGEVYLTPDSLQRIHAPENLEPVTEYALPEGPTVRAVTQEQVEVYRADEAAMRAGRLKNETAEYEERSRSLSPAPPRRVDVGNRLDSYLAAQGWYELEVDHRWMSQKATVRIGGAKESGGELQLTGYCPVEQTRNGPLVLQIYVDGKFAGSESFSQPESPFFRHVRVPPGLAGKEEWEVTLLLNKTFHSAQDPRNLGLAFGVLEVR